METDEPAMERATADARTHGLFLGKRWYDLAEGNIDRWGHQRHDTTFLALVEEIGEIAMALENGSGPYGGLPPIPETTPEYEGARLIGRMAELGRDTREYLETHYPTPAGDGDDGKEHEVLGEPLDEDARERMFEEVDDAAPLLFQLYWALERCEPDGDDGGRDD